MKQQRSLHGSGPKYISEVAALSRPDAANSFIPIDGGELLRLQPPVLRRTGLECGRLRNHRPEAGLADLRELVATAISQNGRVASRSAAGRRITAQIDLADPGHREVEP